MSRRLRRVWISLIVFLFVVVIVFVILQFFYGRNIATTSIATIAGAICAFFTALNKIITDTRITAVMDWIVKNQSILQQYVPAKWSRWIPTNKDHFSILFYAPDDEVLALEIKNTLEKEFICDVMSNPWNYPNEFQTILKKAKEAIHCIVVLTQKFYDDLQKDPRSDIFVNGLCQLATIQDNNSKGTLLLFPTLQVQDLFLGPTLSSFSITEDTLEGFVNGNLSSSHCQRRNSVSSQTAKSAPATAAVPQQPVGPLPAAAQEIFIIPHEPNPFFLDRNGQPELTLEKLESNFRYRNSGNTQILWGLNGNGKTQIVLAFARKFQFSNKTQVASSNPYSCILWLDATTSVGRGLVDLNKELLSKHPPKTAFKDDPADSLNEYKKLQNWLGDYEEQSLTKLPGKRWLLIIDKCKREHFQTPYKIFKELDKGDIFFTMHEDPGANGGNIERRIEVDGMETRQGMLLLERTARINPTFTLNGVATEREETVQAIVEALEGNPLAIDTAAAYINTNSPEEFLKNYENEVKFLFKRPQSAQFAGKKVGQVFPPVAAAWYVAFERIQEPGNEYAYQLLLLCAYLEFDTIPPEIIKNMPENNTYPLQDDGKRDTALNLLRSLSVIKWDYETYGVRLKKIVRDLVHLGWYSAIGQDAKGEKRASRIRSIRAVSVALPKTDADWDKNYALYLPHIRKCVEYIEKLLLLNGTDDVLVKKLAALETAVNLDIVHLLRCTGRFLRRCPKVQKTPAEAEHLLVQALRIRGKIVALSASDYPDRATCLYELATFYFERSYQSDTSKLKQAKDTYEEALAEVLKELATPTPHMAPPRSVDEARLRDRLGQVYTDLGDCDEARNQYERALAVLNSRLENALDLARVKWLLQRAAIRNNLAVVFMKEGDKAKHTSGHAEPKKIYEQGENEYNLAKIDLEEAETILQEKSMDQKALMDLQKAPKKTPELLRIEELWEELKHLRIRCDINLAICNICNPVRIGKARYQEMAVSYNKAIEEASTAKDNAEKAGLDVSEKIYLQLIIRHNNLAEIYRRWGNKQHYQDAKKFYEGALGYYEMYFQSYLKSRGEDHPIIKVIQENLETLSSKISAEEQEKHRVFKSSYDLARREG